MIRLPKDIMTHILSYCNEPLTLYKNTHTASSGNGFA